MIKYQEYINGVSNQLNIKEMRSAPLQLLKGLPLKIQDLNKRWS